MKPRRALVTVVTRNYAHYAQVLLQACKQHHPEADLFVCYADRPPESWRESVPGTKVVYGDELGIADWARFSFQYTPFELSCALKPYVIGHVLAQGYDQIAYLDGDMTLYGPLAAVFGALEKDSIVLTPHLLARLPPDGKRPDESVYLTAGAYNAGFFAVRNDSTTRAFIDWWQAMCRRQCIVDLANSLFVDQKWLGLVPGLFEGVHLLRHRGYNTGHWSLSQFEFREIPVCAESQSRVSVGGDPLVLFHFSGMTPNDPHQYLTSQTRKTLTDIPALGRLVERYHADLAAAGMATCSAWGCEFNTLNDGTNIHPGWREAVRQPHKTLVGIENPFDALSQPELVATYKALEPGAYKWRRDWRLKWPKEQGAAGKVRSANIKLKGFLKRFKTLRRSA